MVAIACINYRQSHTGNCKSDHVKVVKAIISIIDNADGYSLTINRNIKHGGYKKILNEKITIRCRYSLRTYLRTELRKHTCRKTLCQKTHCVLQQ